MTTTQLFPPGDVPQTTAFTPDAGGRGIDFPNITGVAAIFILPVGHGQSFIVSNDSPVWWRFGFGNALFVATQAYIPVPPYTQLPFTFPNDASLTHVSVITRGGIAYGTINFGRGE